MLLDRFCFFVIFFAWLGVEFTTTTGDDKMPLRLQNGTTTQARLIGLRSDRVIVSQRDSKPTEVPLEEILSLGNPTDQPEFDQIVFRNGSVLVAIVKSVGLEKIQIESRVWNNKFIPTHLVKGIVFHPLSTVVQRQIEIDGILKSTHSKVQLRLDNNDTVQGRLDQSNSIEQTKSSGGIFFEINGQSTTVAIGKTRSITFTAVSGKENVVKDPDLDPFELGLSDGTLLIYESSNVTADSVSLALTSRFELKADAMIRGKSFWSRVCYFRPSSKSIRFLSDEKPFRIVDSKTELNWKTRFNRSVIGGRLIVGNLKTTKGIGTHAESQVIYLIRKNDKTFRCSVGIDPSASKFGEALCRVVLLNKESQWVPYLESFTVSAGGKAKEMTIDVSSYRAIGLVTQKANHGTVGDRVNWMDARIVSVK